MLSSYRGARRANNPGGEHRSCGAALGGGNAQRLRRGAAAEVPLPNPNRSGPRTLLSAIQGPLQAEVSPTCSPGAVASPLPASNRGLAPPSRRLLQVSMLVLWDGLGACPVLVWRSHARPAKLTCLLLLDQTKPASLHHCSDHSASLPQERTT